MNGLKIKYLDELRFLHCFKLLSKFDRRYMFNDDALKWIKKCQKSDVYGKRLLAKIMLEYNAEILSKEDV